MSINIQQKRFRHPGRVLIWACLLAAGSGQPLSEKSETQIESINLDTKKNGIFIRIRSDKPIPLEEVTGWTNESTGWFYITLHGVEADTAELEAAPHPYPITRIESTHAGESIQIGLKLKTPVEQFEFYHSGDPPEVLVLLRFPLAEVLASIESPPKKQGGSVTGAFENPRHQALVRGLYFTGVSLATVGVLAGKNRNGWEIPIGLGLVSAAYVLDHFIPGSKM